MTVTTQQTVFTYTANGTATAFSFACRVLAATDLVVKVNDVIQVGTYTVSGVGLAAGGTVTFTVAPVAAAIVRIYRAMRLERLTDYQTAGDFLASVVNPDFDRSVMMIQDLVGGSVEIGNTLRVPAGEAIATLPSAAARASRVLAFDTTGAAIALVGVDASSAAALQLDLADASSTAKGDALVAVKLSDAGAIATTQHAWNQAQVRNVVSDFGLVADGVTDQTTALLALTAAGGLFVIPRNVLYNRTTLLATMSTSAVLLDLSVINDYRSAGETSKTIGIVSKDTDVSDTHWAIESGHHAILRLGNFGTAPTTSAAERKGSIIWTAGHFQTGAADKRGFRGGAILQFTKDTGNTHWIYTLRSLAPWVAINGAYEDWATGQVIAAAGVYRTNGTNHYVSAGAGTTGAVPPSHTTGTVSDGAVSWTWLDSTDRSVFGVDQYGRWLVGNGSYGDTFTHKVSPTDPTGGVFTHHGKSTGVSKVAQLLLTPTDAAGVETPQPYFRAEAGTGLRVMKSDSSGGVATFTDTGFLHGLEGTLGAAPTIASAATIAPTTPFVFVSGTTAIVTITPPAPLATSGGEITLIPTGIWTTTTAGNIALASTAVVGKALRFVYDSSTTKFYPSY